MPVIACECRGGRKDETKHEERQATEDSHRPTGGAAGSGVHVPRSLQGRATAFDASPRVACAAGAPFSVAQLGGLGGPGPAAFEEVSSAPTRRGAGPGYAFSPAIPPQFVLGERVRVDVGRGAPRAEPLVEADGRCFQSSTCQSMRECPRSTARRASAAMSVRRCPARARTPPRTGPRATASCACGTTTSSGRRSRSRRAARCARRQRLAHRAARTSISPSCPSEPVTLLRPAARIGEPPEQLPEPRSSSRVAKRTRTESVHSPITSRACRFFRRPSNSP